MKKGWHKMNHTISTQIEKILENAQGNTLDICYTLYCEYMSQSENPSEVLQYILQYGVSIGTQDAPSVKVSDEVINRVSKSYYKLLHEIVRLNMSQNDPVDEFYKKLYEQIFISALFPQEDTERAVILWLLMEKIPEIPYYQAVNLLKKSDEDYQDAIRRLMPKLLQAVHMVNRHFGSRTEETSQLVRIASEIEDETDRIIYWSALISMMLGAAQSKSQE